MADLSVSLADPRFTRAVTAYQSLSRALSALGLEDDARVREALETLEECLVLGALRGWLPRLAARQPPIDVGALLPESRG
jgi:hypothetical protein